MTKSPITFTPLYMERVWGGRTLETLLGRDIPRGVIGESWEMVDRENEQSIVKSGPYLGKTLQDLWSQHQADIFGVVSEAPRFPILMKILDAQDDLSIQVHPPEEATKELGGEPKSEMWYVADAKPGAKLHVGLKPGVCETAFRSALSNGTVEDCVHSLEPSRGDSIYLQSGRLHAIGGGFLIYEIQQNSDTTFRVYDWNRSGLDGNPRELHVDQSLRCIDFTDVEPCMDTPREGVLTDCESFKVVEITLAPSQVHTPAKPSEFELVTITNGAVTSCDGQQFKAGDFLLQPAGAGALTATEQATLLITTLS